MKKIIVLVVALVISLNYVFSQSYLNNEFHMKARDYANKAEIAFNQGEYNSSIEYSKLAEENAYKSEMYVTEKVAEFEANSRMLFAKNRISYAEDIDADKNYAEAFVVAEKNIKSANIAYEMKNWNTATFYADNAIKALENISEQPQFPMYYVVKDWGTSKDCFWNIAANPAVYNNPWMWKTLYNANKDAMPDAGNPDLLSPGMKVFIPTIGDEVRKGEYSESIEYETFSK